MPIEMKLPELGENVESGDVLRVIVKAGDAIKKDQPVLELETDKATIEVPATAEGVVKEIKVKAGEKVKVGTTIMVLDAAAAGAAAPAQPEAPAPKPAPPAPEPARAAAPQGPVPVPEPKRSAQVVEMTRPKPASAPDGGASVPAAPAARRLARELGVSIQDVSGSGPSGRISMDDVTAYARRLLQSGGGKAVAAAALPDFSAWGAVERKSMGGVRRTTAHHLTQAWTTIPHVFQQGVADITALEALRKRLSKQAEAQGTAPVTLTVFILKIIAGALKKFPQFNSSVDLQAEEIVYKQYVNVGVAVDTDRGLLVPVIRDVDAKDLPQLASELAQAAEKARARKLAPADMQGGSFTISNLGGIGPGTGFTPIINWPEVAILGVSRASLQPVYANGRFEPRLMMPLSLSYDHRVIDGADGVRFLRWVVDALEQPALLWLG